MLLNLDRHPDHATAVIDSNGGRLTYGELRGFGRELKQSIPHRPLIFILAENNIGGVAWIIGMLQAGIVPLILNAHTETTLLTTLYETYQPNYIVKPTDLSVEVIGAASARLKTEYYGYQLLETDNADCPMYNELSHLLPTSGSTGSPKLVRHKYENIESSARNISSFFELTPDDRPLLVLPLYYTMGLSVVFSHLYVGATILITDLNMTDRQFWIFIKEQEATSFTGVPYSYEILNLMRFFRMDLPKLTLLTQGGGKLPRELNLKFAEYCRDTGRRWIATYGQSEGTARMAWLPPELSVQKCGSIGKAIPNGALSLIDAEGKEITDPNCEGEMCYRGKNVTMGYAHSREDLRLGDERNGFLRTGDLAYRDEEGCYYIVGRLGRFLKLYGIRVGLDECEQMIRENLSTECACVGTDKKMIVYVTDESIASAAKGLLVERTKIVASSFEIRTVENLPKNATGKIMYSQLKTE